MNKYYVDYLDKSDDLCHVWVNAYSAENAEDEVRSEYWNIKRIIDIRKAS